jgi:hypothetical protein
MNSTGMSLLRNEYAKNKISHINQMKNFNEQADITFKSPTNSSQVPRAVLANHELTSIVDSGFYYKTHNLGCSSVDTENVGANVNQAEFAMTQGIPTLD